MSNEYQNLQLIKLKLELEVLRLKALTFRLKAKILIRESKTEHDIIRCRLLMAKSSVLVFRRKEIAGRHHSSATEQELTHG